MIFSNQCSLINNNSKLRTYLSHVTDRRLSSVTFSTSGISKIIEIRNSNKAHGHDNISIRICKIFVDNINKTLELIFKQALIIGSYPSNYKKCNIVPQKKGESRILKTTAQCLCFQYAARFLKGFYLVWLVFSQKTTLLLKRNPDLNLLTLG